jgi:hypothetical protein
MVAEKMMPVIVGVMKATPLLPNESSKLNLNGGSLVRYPDPENAGAGDRPVEKRPLPERRYFVKPIFYSFEAVLTGFTLLEFARI